MSEQRELLSLERRQGESEPVERPEYAELKLRRPERRQRCWHEVDVERLVGEDAAVRAIWELSGRFDLSGFASQARTREGERGRALWDPRLLVAIWIWAYSEGISSAREIERQSRWRPELQWLCGLEVVNHHTLSDLRGEHPAALEEIFTQVLALLSAEGLVSLEQVAVDGTRIRSQAATSSERSRPTIERHLEQARAQVRRLSEQGEDETATRRGAAARQRAARERVERLEAALDQLQQVEAIRARSNKNKSGAARVSTSEPEARRQRESNGGYATGYNAQLATDADNKIVVGVELTATASDAPQLEPTLADAQQRMGRAPRQVLADEGYNSRANLEAMQTAGIEYATPPPEPHKRCRSAARAAGIAAGYESTLFVYDETTDTFRCPADKPLTYQRSSSKRNRKYRQYQARGSDCGQCAHRLQCCPKSYERGRTVSRADEDAVLARHRVWMQTERAKAAYRRRSEVAEFPNAWLKERFGLRKFRLRGLRKARTELLWAVLAYNVRHWMRLVWRGPAQRWATT